MPKTISIETPAGWRFSDLRLRREDNGDVSFDTDALRAVLVNPSDYDWLMSHHEDALGEVLHRLYAASVEHLGAEDPVQETIIAEVLEEDRIAVFAPLSVAEVAAQLRLCERQVRVLAGSGALVGTHTNPEQRNRGEWRFTAAAVAEYRARVQRQAQERKPGRPPKNAGRGRNRPKTNP